jgi:heptosyltransferase-2
MGERMKIAVKVTNWVGDVVMNLPALEILRENHPDAEIVAIARPWVEDLLAYRKDLVDRVILFDDRKQVKGLRALYRFGQGLKAEKFDMGVALTRHFKGAFLLWAAGIPERIGFATLPSRPFLNRSLNREILPKGGRHQSQNYVDLLRIAGGMETGESERRPRLFQDEKSTTELTAKFLEGRKGPYLVIHPGAAYGTSKCWLPERFGEVSDQFLAQTGGTVIILGVPDERPAAEGILAKVKHEGLVDLVGNSSLADSIGLTSMADMVISNDSGMMHVAAAFGIPQVAIFGPTHVDATFPFSDLATVLHHPVPCSPCSHRVCPKEEHYCMTAVKTEEVTGVMADTFPQQWGGQRPENSSGSAFAV